MLPGCLVYLSSFILITTIIIIIDLLPPPFTPSRSDTVDMRRFASFTAAVALLLVVSLPLNNAVVDVVGPWNKLVRDVVVAHKLGTSDSSRIMASLHLAQFQAVTDLLSTQHKTAADVDKDPQLHAEVLAAVAGAGKSVLEKISYAGQKPEDGFIFAGPVSEGEEGEGGGGEGGGHLGGEEYRGDRQSESWIGLDWKGDEAATCPSCLVRVYWVVVVVVVLP